MRRADRLFQIIQLLRTRRLTTARWLAEELEVSQRTVYRDIQDLISHRVPISGEAGVGYVLHKSYHLPPLMFTTDELTSLVIGARMSQTLGGNIEKHARSALSKLESALPDAVQQQLQAVQIYAPFTPYLSMGPLIEQLNQGICQKRTVQIAYRKPTDNTPILRSLYPLGIFYWNEKWTLVAWCQLRDDFRHFRLDRIESYQLTEQHFTLQARQTLRAYLTLVTACSGDGAI